MKACPQHQQNLSLLAADVLDEPERHALQSHMAECPGCRGYLRELSEICREHSAAAENLPPVEVSSDFHRRLVRRIEAGVPAASSRSASLIQMWLAVWRWRIALPVGVALTILILATNQQRPRVEIPPPRAARVTPPAVHVTKADSPATLRDYRRAARQSPEALDALLAREATPSAEPPVRVTTFTRDLSALTD